MIHTHYTNLYLAGMAVRHKRVLLQEPVDQAAIAATSTYAIPVAPAQQAVVPAGLEPPVDLASAALDALPPATVQGSAAVVAALPVCASDPSYLQVMLACEVSKLATACTNIAQAVLVADINAINTAAAGTTRYATRAATNCSACMPCPPVAVDHSVDCMFQRGEVL